MTTATNGANGNGYSTSPSVSRYQENEGEDVEDGGEDEDDDGGVPEPPAVVGNLTWPMKGMFPPPRSFMGGKKLVYFCFFFEGRNADLNC